MLTDLELRALKPTGSICKVADQRGQHALSQSFLQSPGQARFAENRLGILVLNLRQQLIDQLIGEQPVEESHQRAINFSMERYTVEPGGARADLGARVASVSLQGAKKSKCPAFSTTWYSALCRRVSGRSAVVSRATSGEASCSARSDRVRR